MFTCEDATSSRNSDRREIRGARARRVDGVEPGAALVYAVDAKLKLNFNTESGILWQLEASCIPVY